MWPSSVGVAMGVTGWTIERMARGATCSALELECNRRMIPAPVAVGFCLPHNKKGGDKFARLGL